MQKIRLFDPVGANRIGGWCFQAGNFGLLYLGWKTASWCMLVSSGIYICSAEILRRFGDNDIGFAWAGWLGAFAIVFADYGEISTLRIAVTWHALLTLAGTAVCVFSFVLFGGFCRTLHAKYARAPGLAGHILGRPRRSLGIGGAIGLAPAAVGVFTGGGIPLACILFAFLAGEFFVSISMPASAAGVGYPPDDPAKYGVARQPAA
jgi:hypothetical protein